MMKLLSFKSTSDLLLLFVFLSVLWHATDCESVNTTTQSTNTSTPSPPQNVAKVEVVTQNDSSITLRWNISDSISKYILKYEGESMNVSADQGGESIEYVVSPLTVGTNYSFTLFTVSGNAKSTGYSFSAETAPKQVDQVEVVTQNETSITLRWDKTENISTYILEYDGKSMNVSADQEGKFVEYVVSLTAGTRYSFTLFTVFGNAKSTGYSFFAETVPQDVDNVDVVTQNETSITLRWNKVENISIYILKYDDKSLNISADQEGESVDYVVSPLTAGRNYSFTLFSVFGNHNSTGFSFSAVTAPRNVDKVEVVTQNDSSITLRWNISNSISTYILKYDNKSMNISADQGGESLEYVVSSLNAGKKFSFTLFTVFEGVSSTGLSFFAVTAPKNVDKVEVVTQNETSITLRWNKFNSISTYILTYESEEVNASTDHEGQIVEYVVSNLIAGRNYSFILVTVFEELNSTGYSFCAVTAPKQVDKVEVVTQNETSITLRWNKVESISTYILEYGDKSMNISADKEGKFVEYVVSTLTAGTRYNFTLFTVFGNAKSTGLPVPAVTAPKNVDKVEVVAQNETNITLKWDKVKDISTYILKYDEEQEVNVEDESVEYVVSPLTAGKKYSFTLITVFERVNSSGYSFSAVTAPTKVSSVAVTERFPTKITLQWENPNDAWNYKIEINASDASIAQNRPSNIIFETENVSYSISKLSPGTLYVFSVITQFSGLNSSAYKIITVTTIDCFSVNWHVTNSSIQGRVEGLFSKATATYKSQVHNSSGGPDVSFTGLYPGAAYEISLHYEISSQSLLQCKTIQTLFPPLLHAHCEFWASGYSARIVWNKPDGVWTNVEVNMTGKKHNVDGKEDHLIINGLQPAKKYQVSLASLSGTERKSEPFVFSCPTDPRGVIAGSFFAVLLFGILICVVVFIFLKRPDIIRGKKPFIGGSKVPSATEKAISVAKFPEHFNQLSLDENRGFSNEYEGLASVGSDQARKVATLPENRVKNRFTNVLPYDWCRVKLNTPSPSDILDYINASYMPGYNSKREYIASQGPLPSTVNDFWRMIWEQRAKGIVMVTNCTEGGRTKCEQYWPEDRDPCSYGELVVTVRSEQQEPSWTLREFGLKNRNTSEERTIMHFHFTAWPDHGVPQDTQVLIQFRGLVRQHIESEGPKAPTVVHCSAGVGRTGTIIALDVLLQQLQKEQAVGINAFVHKMRLHRPYMVQTESQYVFLHQCIMDSLQSSVKSAEPIYENTDMIYVNATALRELR